MGRVTVAQQVASRVRALRLQRGWSAQRLADQCARLGSESLRRGTIAKIEAGVRKSVTADEVAILARVLGVTAADLLSPLSHPSAGPGAGNPIAPSQAADLPPQPGEHEPGPSSAIRPGSTSQIVTSQSRWEHPAKCAFWDALAAEDQYHLAALGKPKVFRPGSMLCREGDLTTDVMIIMSGWVKVSAGLSDAERIIAVRGPGDLVGERAALMVRPRSATVAALDDVNTLVILGEHFLASMKNQRSIGQAVHRYLEERLAEDRDRVFAPEVAEAERRLAFLLSTVTQRRGKPRDHGQLTITLPMSQQELAAWAVTRHVTVARHLAAWRAHGIVQTGRRRVTVVDLERLEKIYQNRTGSPAQNLSLSPGSVWPAASNCSIFVADMVGFSDPGRTESDRRVIRDALYQILQEAFDRSSVPWVSCYREDRGDGFLVVAPPRVSPLTITDSMLAILTAGVQRHNRQHSQATRIKLRAAVHAGSLQPSASSQASEPIGYTRGLLGVRAMDRTLAETDADLAFIVSAYVFEAVIRQGSVFVDPAASQRVELKTPGSDSSAWMFVPGSQHRPGPDLMAGRGGGPGPAGGASWPGPPRPAQIPADVPNFTGRFAELAQLNQMLTKVNAERSGGASTIVLSGTAGVGKTALAVRWSHSVRDAFPDGQIYLNLRGYDPDQPVTPKDALARLMRALGARSSDLPEEPDERAAAYRTLLSGRRVLIVLDNAWTTEQVRPLLPGNTDCFVVVTSRDSLAGLAARHGASRISVDLLPPDDAASLLRNLVGARKPAQSEVIGTLARQCAQLPLALRIAGELAAIHHDNDLATLTAELADENHRLDLLDAGGDPRTAVRDVFSWSYRRLPADGARAFRLLGQYPGPDFDARAAAALLRADPQQAQRTLDLLHRSHLIRPSGPGRYSMHELMRLYAVQLAEDRGPRSPRKL